MTYSLDQIPNLSGKTVLLDTNTLLFAYHASLGDEERTKPYTKGMATLMGHKIKTIVTPTILSEFYNRSLKQDYEFHQNDYSSYKIFRNSDIGKECLNAVCVNIRKILQFSDLVTDSSIEADDILDLLKTGKLDFGDALSILTARKHDYVIFTDDIDFKNAKVQVLTGNPKYFR